MVPVWSTGHATYLTAYFADLSALSKGQVNYLDQQAAQKAQLFSAGEDVLIMVRVFAVRRRNAVLTAA